MSRWHFRFIAGIAMTGVVLGKRLAIVLTALMLAGTPAFAGHSRFPYVDGGQSPDGRFVVTAERIETPATGRTKQTDSVWQFTWRDTQTDETYRGQLAGLRIGKSAVFDPVHAHIFVPSGGATFAVWNPQVLARTSDVTSKPPKDLASSPTQQYSGFDHRLTIYKKNGEIQKQFDLKDLLVEADWQWLYCYGCQVYWQVEYPGLATRSAPRPGYALFRISADHTVLETRVGANAEATRKAVERGISLPAIRLLRVHLVEGRLLDAKEPLTEFNTPRPPFIGELISSVQRQEDYRPSLDPVRIPGRFESIVPLSEKVSQEKQ